MTDKSDSGDRIPDPSPSNAPEKDAAEQEAKGSVHEAIGKLIGDDAARDQGRAEKLAGARAATQAKQSPRR